MSTIFTLSQEFLRQHPSEAAGILERLPLDEGVSYLQASQPGPVAAVLIRMDPGFAGSCLVRLEPVRCSEVLQKLSPSESARLLRRVHEGSVTSILDALPKKFREKVNARLHFPEGSAGSLADSGALTLLEDVSVEEAVERIRAANYSEGAGVFVIEKEGRYIGRIPPSSLLQADPKTPVDLICRREGPRLPANAGPMAVLEHPAWKEYSSLPVVDSSGDFLGAIEYHTLRRLEASMEGEGESDPMTNAGNALGEVFWVGMSGLLKGAVSAIQKRK